jgi:phosphatidylglycerophosphate synthase
MTPYDEIGSRTRQAWLRTGLGAAAVSLLLLRGLVIGGTQGWVMAVCLVPGVTFVTFTVIRMRGIEHGRSAPLPTSGVALTLVAVCGIALAAVVSLPGG